MGLMGPTYQGEAEESPKVIYTRTLILTYKPRLRLKQMTSQFSPLREGTLNMINKNNESNTPAKGPPNHHRQEIKKEKEKKRNMKREGKWAKHFLLEKKQC